MNTKICTSVDQSKKLIELGLNDNTADMVWQVNKFHCFPATIQQSVIKSIDAIPAWSLSALLDIIPSIDIHKF